jgi:hypothetical protein
MYGYPESYLRVEQWSTVEVAWEVTEFHMLEAGAATSIQPLTKPEP